MATIKELLSAMIDKINGNEDKIDNIKGVPEAFDSITMTNGTDMANLTMSAEKELLFDGEAIGGVANWDELENKPFYSEEKMIELLPETTFTVTEDGYVQISETIRFVEGKKYNVIFNGTKYECVAWYDGKNGMIIGNGSIYGGNGGNNEPFSCDSYYDKTCYLNVYEPGSYTISISCLDTEFHKLDKNYLPTPSWNDLTDKPFEENITFIYEGNYTVDQKSARGYYEASYNPLAIEDTAALFPNNGEVVLECDGVRYDLGLSVHSSGKRFLVGNGNMYSSDLEDTGEDICIFFKTIEDNYLIVSILFKERGDHDVKFYVVTDVKKIDPKYLPESGSSGGALFVELNIDEETIITPFEEIENAINDNRDIIAYFQNTYLRLEHYVKNYMDDSLLAVTLSGLSSVNKVMFVIEIAKNGAFSVTGYGIELTEK